jgi:hypothetical protein
MALPAEARADWYREIADKLWDFSLDQRRNISFEVRTRLAAIGEEFTIQAAKLERKIAAD